MDYYYFRIHKERKAMHSLLHPILSLLLLCIPMTCLTAGEGLQVHSWRKVSDELSSPAVTAFEQDDDGYLWIGTRSGLNKYDGTSFIQYTHSPDSCSLVSNSIRTLTKTKDGTLWVGTVFGLDSFEKDGIFRHYPLESRSQNVSGIYAFGDDIYVTTLRAILKLDRDKGRFKVCVEDLEMTVIINFVVNDRYMLAFTSNEVYVYEKDSYAPVKVIPLPSAAISSANDGMGHMYLAGEKGLSQFDCSTMEIRPMPVPDLRRSPTGPEQALTLVRSYGSRLILCDGYRLFVYDPATEAILSDADNEAFTPLTLKERVSQVFADSSGNIWYAMESGGFSAMYSHERHYPPSATTLTKALEGKEVTSIAKDRDGCFWIILGHGKLYRFYENVLSPVDMEAVFGENEAPTLQLLNLFADADGYLWISVNMILYQCRVRGGDIETVGKYNLCTDNTENGSLARPDYIPVTTVITQDYSGTIWAGSIDGRFYYREPGARSFVSFDIPNPVLTHMGQILLLSNGDIAGVFYSRGVYIVDPRTRTIKQYYPMEDLVKCQFSAICEDDRGHIYVGTKGDGVLMIDPRTKEISRIKDIVNDDVSAIVRDRKGSLWISTNGGITRYDPGNKESIHFRKHEGLAGNQFSYNSAFCDNTDGIVFFGGNHGLTALPISPALGTPHIPFFFETLYIAGKEYGLENVREVRLTPDERNIEITFSALDYGNSHDLQYAYAFDHPEAGKWISLGRGKRIVWPGIPYGHHTLFVRATSRLDPDYEQTISLDYALKRPFFQSRFAQVVYGLLAALLLFGLIHMGNRLYRSRIQQESMEETNRMRMRFFTNISHELRTPLSMINGAIKQLYYKSRTSDDERRLYNLINRNSDRLTGLVNQILDFEKLDSDVLALSVAKTNAIALLERLTEDFGFAAEQKNITLHFQSDIPVLPMWLDEDKIEKIVHNILSNAIKFTPVQGSIEVTLSMASGPEVETVFAPGRNVRDLQYLKTRIHNTGSSIPDEQLDAVFGRFVQLESGAMIGGTGIGLYLASKLVGIHHGFIRALNEDGGVSFEFILPVNEGEYDDQEKRIEQRQEVKHGLMKSEQDQPGTTPLPAQEKKHRPAILIIDDDYEIVYYLKMLLSGSYSVAAEMDGEEGIRAIESQSPDLVICDVLMPGMDGFEVCRKAKSDLSLSHIPFILLSAKYDVKDQIHGLECGANAYIVKPFDPGYLLATIKSLLDNMNRIRMKLMESTDSRGTSLAIENELDKRFVEALYAFMKDNLTNANVDVSYMARSLGVSRSQLFRKVKALTGETPHGFFNKFKLNVAAEWLLESNAKISAIAADLGFDSAPHFSLIFKKEFGCLPSEYKKLKETAQLPR